MNTNQYEVDPYIDTTRRQAIVGRLDGSTSRVTAASLATPEELAYAIRFLMDHFTYKRSKVGGVKADVVTEVGKAVASAFASYNDDVASSVGVDLFVADDEKPEPDDRTPISRLGEGEITNPFVFTR